YQRRNETRVAAATQSLERSPGLFAGEVVTGAEELEDVGDLAGALALGLVLAEHAGELGIEHLAVVGLRGLVAVGVGLVVRANGSELSGVEENPFALGALVHHDVPFDAPEVPHHDDAGIAGTVAPLLRIHLDGGILIDVEQRLARRLVGLVDLAERPFVELQSAAAALAGLELHIAHRDLGHLGAAGWTVHGHASLARTLRWP